MFGWRNAFWRQGAILLLLVAASVSLLTTARLPDPLTGQERSSQFAGAFDSDNALEQSFVPARDYLTAVEVFALVPPGRLSAEHTLTFHLRENGKKEDLAVWRLPLRRAQSQGRLTFVFPALPQSKGKQYLLRVETTAPPDTVTLLASGEDVYPNGSLRVNGGAVSRDLTFRTYTAIPAVLFAAWVQFALPDYLYLLSLTGFFCLLGGALLILLGHSPGKTLAEWFLWSGGTGLAVVPVAYLLAGQYVAWLLAALVGLAVLCLLWRVLYSRAGLVIPRPTAGDGLLLLVFLWALLVRRLQIQDIPVPMWVDGLRHWQMTQSILETQRIPSGLLYHVGYHTHATLLRPLTGWDLPRNLLLLGQWISAFNGPALFVLALPLFTLCGLKHTRAAALVAAAALTCLPGLPGYLMNWGRYPFLLGLTLMPFFLAALTSLLKTTPAHVRWREGVLPLLLLIGMVLSHYGMLSFSASYIIILLVLSPLAWLRGLRADRVLPLALLLVLLGGVMLALRFGDNLLPRLGEIVRQSRDTQEDLRVADVVHILLRSGGCWLVVFGSLGAIWAYARSKKLLWLSVGWFAAQAALTAVQSPLLGFALANYTNLLLALSIPLALLAGGSLSEVMPYPHSRVRVIVALSVAALIAVTGGLSQMGILNPAALTFSPADVAAMEWIRANTAPSDRFLINSTPWGDEQIVPSDGGGWITPLTGRSTVFLAERQPPLSWDAYISRESVDYIYLGRHSGFLTHGAFESNPLYRPVYDQQGIKIFAVTR